MIFLSNLIRISRMILRIFYLLFFFDNRSKQFFIILDHVIFLFRSLNNGVTYLADFFHMRANIEVCQTIFEWNYLYTTVQRTLDTAHQARCFKVFNEIFIFHFFLSEFALCLIAYHLLVVNIFCCHMHWMQFSKYLSTLAFKNTLRFACFAYESSSTLA